MTDVTFLPLAAVPEAELRALSDAVFCDEEPSPMLAEVLAAEAQARQGQPQAAPAASFGLAAYRGPELVGWTEGFRYGTHQFHMFASGVLPSERRRGVYSQLVRAVLDHARAEGCVAVRSLHVAANSPVIIAKLKLGFCISGFEYSEVYGPLVQLRHVIGEPRRALYRARTVSLRTPR